MFLWGKNSGWWLHLSQSQTHLWKGLKNTFFFVTCWWFIVLNIFITRFMLRQKTYFCHFSRRAMMHILFIYLFFLFYIFSRVRNKVHGVLKCRLKRLLKNSHLMAIQPSVNSGSGLVALLMPVVIGNKVNKSFNV